MTVATLQHLLRLRASLLVLDVASAQGQPYVVVTQDNWMDVVAAVASSQPGIYHDPERLLDSAIVDKMIVV